MQLNYSHSSDKGLAQRRGVILVAVLGFILLLAIFVTQFLDITTRQIRMRAVEMGRTDLRTTAYSAMQVTIAVLNEFKEIDEGLNRPSQGWGDPMSYAEIEWPDGIEVKVTVEDESGRIPLDPVPEEDIKTLLENMDIGFTEADEMIDSLIDWTDENDLARLNGAEESYYEREDPPYVPPNDALSSFSHLSKIRGFKEEFFDEEGVPNSRYYQFINAVSLHNNGKININTVSPNVLAAYAEESGFDDDQFFDYMSGLDRVPGNDDDEILRSADDLSAAGFRGASESFGFTMNLARVTVKVTSGEKHFSLVALVETGSSSQSENSNNEEGEEGNEEPGQSPSGANNSSGNQANSGFKITRLVENANFD